MKFDKIKVSSRTTHAFGMLKISTGLEPNVLARFALCLSLRQQGIPNPDEYNREGSEYTAEYLFGNYEQMYAALLADRLRDDELDVEHYFTEMTRCHINRGAIGLRQRVGGLGDFHRLVSGCQIA